MIRNRSDDQQSMSDATNVERRRTVGHVGCAVLIVAAVVWWVDSYFRQRVLASHSTTWVASAVSERGQFRLNLFHGANRPSVTAYARSYPTASVLSLMEEGVWLDNEHDFRIFDLGYPLANLLPPLDVYGLKLAGGAGHRGIRIPYWLIILVTCFTAVVRKKRQSSSMPLTSPSPTGIITESRVPSLIVRPTQQYRSQPSPRLCASARPSCRYSTLTF